MIAAGADGLTYYCDFADVFRLLHNHGLFSPLVNMVLIFFGLKFIHLLQLPDESKKMQLRELHDAALAMF